jgi:IS5 family transposase
VETNIHYPTDASLLNDSVRVLCRILSEARRLIGDGVVFTNHRRRAKAKLRLIHNVRGEEKRHPLYLELIRVTKDNLSQAVEAVLALKAYATRDTLLKVRIDAVRQRLETYVIRVKKVVDQAYRRVVKKESVPASDKIVSIFEEHTDIPPRSLEKRQAGNNPFLHRVAPSRRVTLRTNSKNRKPIKNFEGSGPKAPKFPSNAGITSEISGLWTETI